MRPSSPTRKSMRPTSRMPSARTAILEIARSRDTHVARQVGRAAHRHLARLGGLEPVVVEVEAAARRRIDHVVDRQQHALVAAPLEERHGHVDAGDELLDQHAGRVGAQRARQHLGQRARVAHDRVVADALRRALVVRLDDHRQRQPQRPRIAAARRYSSGVTSRAARRVDARAAPAPAWSATCRASPSGRRRPSRCTGSRAPRTAPGRTPRARARAAPRRC